MIDVELVEAVADAVAARLERGAAPRRLLTADELAAYLGVERSWCYEHAVELGALRLGEGARPRLRFELERVQAALACRHGRESSEPLERVAEPKRRSGRRRALGTGAPLLPIRGRGGVS